MAGEREAGEKETGEKETGEKETGEKEGKEGKVQEGIKKYVKKAVYNMAATGMVKVHAADRPYREVHLFGRRIYRGGVKAPRALKAAKAPTGLFSI